MEKESTKDRIMHISAKLFSEMGYDKVSMRDIAAEVGIKAASIYNHFPSKRDILKHIFEFYEYQQSLVCPTVDELLVMAETEPIEAVFGRLRFEYPPEISDLMGRAIMISSRGITGEEDGESEKFVRQYHFDTIQRLSRALLNRLIELKRIQPLDVDAFTNVLTYYGFSAAFLSQTPMTITEEQYTNGLTMIFSAIKVILPSGQTGA